MKTGFMRMSASDKKIIIGIFSLITIITACVKTTSTPPLTPTTSSIGQIIAGASKLTILDSAMSASGLLLTLDSTNSVSAPFTLFAPTDMAFLNAGFTDSTVYYFVKNSQRDSLKRFLGHYIYAGQGLIFSTGSFPVGINVPLSMIYGDTIFYSVVGGSLYINGILVSQTDIIANNGVIQALSGVFFPPTGNIMNLIQSDTSLSFLDTAIIKASQGDTNIISMLTTGVYTIFAPTNNAFRSIGYLTSTFIDSLNSDSLARLLTTHILNGRVFTSNFGVTDSITSISGDSLFINTTFGYTIQSIAGDSTGAATMGPVNILATNGVIQKINLPLLPYYPFYPF